MYDSSDDGDSSSNDDEYRQPGVPKIEPERAQPTRFAKMFAHRSLEPRVGNKFQVDVVPLARWAPAAAASAVGSTHGQREPLLVPTEQIAAELAERAELRATGQALERTSQALDEYIDARYLSMGTGRARSPAEGSPRAVARCGSGEGGKEGRGQGGCAAEEEVAEAARRAPKKAAGGFGAVQPGGFTCKHCGRGGFPTVQSVGGHSLHCPSRPLSDGLRAQSVRGGLMSAGRAEPGSGTDDDEDGDGGASGIRQLGTPKGQGRASVAQAASTRPRGAALFLTACHRSFCAPRPAGGSKGGGRREPWTKAMLSARRGCPRLAPSHAVTRLRRDDETEDQAPPPPPPAGWRWPREGEMIEIETEIEAEEAAEEAAERRTMTLWRAATVLAVLVDGWFSARMLHDDEWVDWFTCAPPASAASRGPLISGR